MGSSEAADLMLFGPKEIDFSSNNLCNSAKVYTWYLCGVRFHITRDRWFNSGDYGRYVIHITEMSFSKSAFLSIGISTDEFEILNESDQIQKLKQTEYMKSCEDVKIILKSDTKTEEITCHSAILCLRSEYFSTLFNSGLSESNEKCITLYTSKEAIDPIIQYIYTSEMDKDIFASKNYEIILETYSKICEFQIEELKPIFQVFILEYLDEENLKLLNQSGILMQDDSFSKIALKFIVGHFNY
ncbi:hypothetical protein CONCODRAFT_68770 [Conidiobolus coronatus NRRL 28638]|uniref:BTB domain-containing protein n=1 Tax=Conidiobolus coronatus (strain ATCC 28846 / CBS 209.66 / NRRL 28638) TaxID=796925 RepID=A0A137PCR2_CONC2|nr:hypothetical protein CONCODRAFT_68770 [Conidiobolus coronatus NRRL 28638]|eukprot:KXN72765.1 hypothetical protein CONCODRAFT_68770 [Conidiobolus coronatus NRRL 28638]